MDFIKLVVFRSRTIQELRLLAEGVRVKRKPLVSFSPPKLMTAYLSKLIVIGRYDVFYDRRKLNEPLYFADFMRLLWRYAQWARAREIPCPMYVQHWFVAPKTPYIFSNLSNFKSSFFIWKNNGIRIAPYKWLVRNERTINHLLIIFIIHRNTIWKM